MNAFFGILRPLLRHGGIDIVVKIFRYGFSKEAWAWLISQLRFRRIVKESGLVDEDWYRREYPDVAEGGVSPVSDFLSAAHFRTRLPNPDFVPEEYSAMNLDVKAGFDLPAVHYVTNGIRENRPVSTLENLEQPFPANAVELRREFPQTPATHRRTAIFASFSADGHIKETVLYYLRGLREVVDNIIFVANSPVFQEEVEKLDGLVRLAVFRNHGSYDFGSYKIGWNEATALRLLEPDICDELVVCNDSCYGPVFPFSEAFAEMDRRRKMAEIPADFWGMSVVEQYGRTMIPSYFYAFGPAVLEGGELGRWFEKMEPCRERGEVIMQCESMLTQHLIEAGYFCDGIVPEAFQKRHKASPIKFPLNTMRDYHDPLVKIKAIKGDSLDDLDDTREFLQKTNPELAALIPTSRKRAETGIAVVRAARLGHEVRLSETEAVLRQTMADGSPVPIVILTLTGTETWLKPLFCSLCADARFSVSVSVVPDMRLKTFGAVLEALRASRIRLSDEIPEVAAETLHPNSYGVWPEVFPDSGVVVFPAADEASDFHYNPHHALGRRVLPVLVFDRNSVRYPLEKEFARQNYAYFWKVFFTDRKEYDLYVKHSIRKGENAEFLQGSSAVAERLSSALS